jgi:hypothetical protein
MISPPPPSLRTPSAWLLAGALGLALVPILACQPAVETPASERSESSPEQPRSSDSPDATSATATGPPVESPRIAVDEPRRITLQELRRLTEVEQEPVLMVDVRSRESFAQRHARGAVSLPLAEIPARAREELPAEPLLVTYCT